MKDLIIQALNEALILLDKRTPQTKRAHQGIEINDVKPIDLARFIAENNIPSNAFF